jgi:hypothetical protein
VISVIRPPVGRRDRRVPYLVEVDGQQIAELMPKEEVHLPVSAGEHEVLARISAVVTPRVSVGSCSSPTETVEVESGGERHLLVRPSPVPMLIATIWLSSNYLHWIDAKTARPLTCSARLRPWYLRSVLMWAILLVVFFFATRVEPHIMVAWLSWFYLAAFAIGLAASINRGLRRNQI